MLIIQVKEKKIDYNKIYSLCKKPNYLNINKKFILAYCARLEKTILEKIVLLNSNNFLPSFFFH